MTQVKPLAIAKRFYFYVFWKTKLSFYYIFELVISLETKSKSYFSKY